MEKTNFIYEVLTKKETLAYLGFLAVVVFLTNGKYRSIIKLVTRNRAHQKHPSLLKDFFVYTREILNTYSVFNSATTISLIILDTGLCCSYESLRSSS